MHLYNNRTNSTFNPIWPSRDRISFSSSCTPTFSFLVIAPFGHNPLSY
jgi:hypothetical protein